MSSTISYNPVLDSEYSSDKEYCDNEVCSEDKRVNDFEYDEEQLLSFAISIEEEDTFVKKFYSWLEWTDGGKKSTCDAEKHRLVLMSIAQFEQEYFQINYTNVFDREYLNE